MNYESPAINKEQWEEFAKKDPLFYIDTDVQNNDQFWKKGEDNFQTFVLPILKKYQINRNRAVDFGCGIGRHTLPLATYFNYVIGVDVSTNMLEQAKILANHKGLVNINFYQNENFFLQHNKIDFIYCVNVFQHIEDIEQIKSILKHFSESLNGFAYIQFDTRPKNILYEFKNILPNFMLSRAHRRGIRRIRRDANKLEHIIKTLGFSIAEQNGIRSKYHFFLLQKLQ